MPQVGQDIETATIVAWHKKENDMVHKGDIIATVESDKASFDVEVYDSGVLLKRLYEEGQEVKVLTPIAYLGEPGESMNEAPSTSEISQTTVAPASPVSAEKTKGSLEVMASPSARRLAKEKGIDLSTLVGTGPRGRITKDDVLAVASGQQALVHDMKDEIIAFSPMRSRIAERLSRSKQTIPHFYLFTEVDMTEVCRRCARFNEQNYTNITINDVIIKAVGQALVQHPRMNSHVEKDRIIVKKAVHIGVAVSVPDGLAVPVIADVPGKTLVQISQESRENAEAIRAGKLLSNTVGTFTVSNLGMYAVNSFLPIINPPECAILGVGQAAEKPAVVQGKLAVRRLMSMTLACDHRTVDGTMAGQFLETIKQQLENSSVFPE